MKSNLQKQKEIYNKYYTEIEIKQATSFAGATSYKLYSLGLRDTTLLCMHSL